MQGSFWSNVLAPDVDDEAQRLVRNEEAAALRAREVRRVRNPDEAGDVEEEDAPAVLEIDRPIAPPLRLMIKREKVFVVPGYGFELRKGEFGHYLVTYVKDRTTGRARPFKRVHDKHAERPTERGYPGTNNEKGPDGKRQALPDKEWCTKGVDFTVPEEGYWEVGLTHLQRVLEEAEAADLAFARRMEGFANVAPSVVWSCLDPDYDPSDREAVMAQFMTKYLEKFYSRLDAGSEPSVEAVSAEALHKHRAFCKAWTEKHYRGLTPAVTAPAEALAGEFYAHLEPRMRPHRLTRLELARLLIRHDEFSAEFAQALHYYTANLEQTRAGRNASYKQIRMMGAARVTSYNTLGALLAAKDKVLGEALAEACKSKEVCMLHPFTVDWYDLLGQAPPVHRYFEDATPYKGLSETRRATAEGRVPPWRFGRSQPAAP